MSALKTSALRLIKPFAIRDYALLASALVLSTFAAGMWTVAMVYQVRRLDGGPVELSMVATVNAVGLLCFVLFGGIMADRHSCRRIVVLVESFSFVLMTLTAVLAISGALELWHLMLAGFLWVPVQHFSTRPTPRCCPRCCQQTSSWLPTASKEPSAPWCIPLWAQ